MIISDIVIAFDMGSNFVFFSHSMYETDATCNHRDSRLSSGHSLVAFRY